MSYDLYLTCLSCGQKNRVAADKPAAQAVCGSCKVALLDGKVWAVDPAKLDKAKGDSIPLVVDFWAPWCGPCRAMAPEFEKAAKVMAGHVRFAKIDTQKFPAANARYRVSSIPCLVRFQDGRESARQVGSRPASQIAGFARGGK